VISHLLAGGGAAGLEPRRLPHLELLSESDEGHVSRKTGMRAKRLRKHDASVLVDGKRMHVTIERDRQLVPLVRIVRQAIEKPVDVVRKPLAASIAAPGIPVALKDRPERRRHRHAPLGVDLVDECGNKAVHPRCSSLAPTPTNHALLLRPDAPDRPLPLERPTIPAWLRWVNAG
jgi:hypothetical protein